MTTLEKIAARKAELILEYNPQLGLSINEWLTEKLIDAEERAAHHAEIAAVCSATAERYEAELMDISIDLMNLAMREDLGELELCAAMERLSNKAWAITKEAE